MLAFLVQHRDRPQTRDLLAGRFWSDLPEDKARRRLTQELWRIRSVVNPALGDGVDIIESVGRSLRINPEVEIETDVDHFIDGLDQLERRQRNDRRSVNAEDVAAVVDRYRGDLLSGHYDEWIELPRTELRRRHLDAQSRLAQLHARNADFEAALRCALALVAAEPLADHWQRDVIRYYALNGQPTAAEQYYERYVDELERDFGARPPAETVELVERLRTEGVEPPPQPMPDDQPALPLIGREQERTLLLDRVNDLLDGRGGVALVEGEAGSGKSRLMEELASGAEWRNVQVLWAGHDRARALSPFGGLQEALRPLAVGLRGERLASRLAPVWLRQASTVLPELAALVEGRGGDQALRPQEEPWRTIEALALVILAQGSPQPTLLIMEDVQWCDDDTIQVLNQLGDRLADSGVLLFLTYERSQAEQSAELWRVLSSLEAKPGSSRVGLRPMSLADVRALAAAELGSGQLSEPALAQLAATSNGNPYVVLELLRSGAEVLDEEFFSRALDGDGGQGTASVLPWLRSVLAKRIDAARPQVRRVLEAVAVVAAPAGASVVAQVADLGLPEALEALSEAVSSGFLSEVPGGVEFAVEQPRLLVYDELGPERQVELHGRVVDALVEAGAGSVEQMAYHADRARQWHRAHQYHSLAAEAGVALNAFKTAAEHFARADRAASEIGLLDRDRIDDLLAHEAVLNVLGRREEQQDLLTRLEGKAPGTTLAVEIEQRWAWLLANTDRALEAADRAAEAAEAAAAEGHNPGELLTVVGVARYWSGDLEGAIEPFEQAIEVLTEVGRPSTMAEIMLGRTLVDQLRMDDGQAHLEAAYDRAKADHNAREQVEALTHLATVFHFQRNGVRAEAAFLEALDLAVEIGYRHGEGLNLINLAAFYTLGGRGGKSLPLVERAEAVFASLGNGRLVAYAQTNCAELLHWLGDDDRAQSRAEEAAVYFRSVEDARLEAMCLTTLASIDHRKGRRRLARRRLEAARARSQEAGDVLTLAAIAVNRALVELDLGHLDRAMAEVETAAELRRAHDELATMGAVVLAVEARIHRVGGDMEVAVERVHEAITVNRPTSHRAHLTAWWCAQILEEGGFEEGAREQVALAHQVLLRMFENLPDDLRVTAWGLAEHRAIADARERYFVDQGEWRLPRWDAPTGRPLEADDYVDVVLTLSEPGDRDRSQAGAVRQHRIRRLIEQARRQGARIRVLDLAEVLGVSERTIKRDLSVIRDVEGGPELDDDFPGYD